MGIVVGWLVACGGILVVIALGRAAADFATGVVVGAGLEVMGYKREDEDGQ